MAFRNVKCGIGYGEVVTYSFETVAYEDDVVNAVPIEGVTICEEYSDRYATSDGLGLVALDVPANQAVVFTSEKEGFGRSIEVDISDENAGPVTGFPHTWFLWTDAQLEAIAEQLQTTYPWPQGMVGLVRWIPIAGVTFAPVGSTIVTYAGTPYAR